MRALRKPSTYYVYQVIEEAYFRLRALSNLSDVQSWQKTLYHKIIQNHFISIDVNDVILFIHIDNIVKDAIVDVISRWA